MFRKREGTQKDDQEGAAIDAGRNPREFGVLEATLKYFTEELMRDHLCKMMLVSEITDI